MFQTASACYLSANAAHARSPYASLWFMMAHLQHMRSFRCSCNFTCVKVHCPLDRDLVHTLPIVGEKGWIEDLREKKHTLILMLQSHSCVHKCGFASIKMKTMYLMFIRSILEYGSILYMGAAKSHLDKLDRVQTAAEKLGNFKVESLQSRREAAAMSMGLKPGNARIWIYSWIWIWIRSL